jgi:hypothetical protein
MPSIETISEMDLFIRFLSNDRLMMVMGRMGSGKTELARTFAYLNRRVMKGDTLVFENGVLASHSEYQAIGSLRGEGDGHFRVRRMPEDYRTKQEMAGSNNGTVLVQLAEFAKTNAALNKDGLAILDHAWDWNHDQLQDTQFVDLVKGFSKSATSVLKVDYGLADMIRDRFLSNPTLDFFEEASIKVFFGLEEYQLERLAKYYAHKLDDLSPEQIRLLREFHTGEGLVIAGKERYRLKVEVPRLVVVTRLGYPSREEALNLK